MNFGMQPHTVQKEKCCSLTLRCSVVLAAGLMTPATPWPTKSDIYSEAGNLTAHQ